MAPEIQRVFATIQNPSLDGKDSGTVAEAYFTVENGIVVMCDQSGLPITDQSGAEFHATAEPGNERRVAARLVHDVRARLT